MEQWFYSFRCDNYEENNVICCYYCKSLIINSISIIFDCELTYFGWACQVKETKCTLYSVYSVVKFLTTMCLFLLCALVFVFQRRYAWLLAMNLEKTCYLKMVWDKYFFINLQFRFLKKNPDFHILVLFQARYKPCLFTWL